MEHRSRLYFFTERLRVFFQPVPPSSRGLSGPPDTAFCGGIDSAVTSSSASGPGQRPVAAYRLVPPDLLRRFGRLDPRPGLHLGDLGLGPGLHVGLGGQLLHGLPETLPGLLDLLLDVRRGLGCGIRCAHRCVLPLISSTSALTSATACSGSGGVALLMRCLPSSAATPAAASRAAPTMSAASQAATTPLMAMIAQASRQPTP